MIHRALLGSLERFMGVLIEHYAGALPLWLSPVQVEIIPVSDKYLDTADQVAATLRQADIRVDIDRRSEKIGYKIRSAELQKIPYMAIIGEKEAASGTVSVRRHKEGDKGALEIAAFVDSLQREIADRR